MENLRQFHFFEFIVETYSVMDPNTPKGTMWSGTVSLFLGTYHQFNTPDDAASLIIMACIKTNEQEC